MKWHEVPQIVGEAIESGWQYLAFTCLICRRQGRIYLDNYGPGERLASIIRRLRCEDCGRRTQTDTVIGYETLIDPYPFERDIFVEGNNVLAKGRF